MWLLIQRISVVLMTALSTDQLIRIFSSSDIKSDRIYSLADFARMLKVEKGVVRELIKSGDLKARKVKGKYKIMGQNIKDFLKS